MPRILPIELKEFDATTLSGVVQNFGSVLSNPATKISIFNNSNVDCYLSSNAQIPQTMRIVAGGTLTLDESTLYFRGIDQEYYFPRGTQLTLLQVTGAATLPGEIVAHIVTRMSP